ncbi:MULTISPECIES: chemotaxis protein CheV [Vibrio]|jgi:two-component system chemotaxis response regulator CheV|uniref:Chemotaxis protein CheV n=7 Tax=Vibrio TaxID=662 RepID=A0AA92LRK0_9VIBR|nr:MULTISPECIES: chemotaxis protein CheV [Vibrio]EEZ84138.1 chemotaxis protein CheV [Vibrio alginolyticus 40B]KOY46458.1 chemotaxis protein CheW [Vibrio parahaemolyticus]MDW1807774.1 chemotaxis protein CheV [Vibrio sp. Vb2362]MDW2260100.1 chemotaxis protein CheV [Vibrio sp. 1409]MDW2295248.1 chemotaxis protein CheV [Vibrio sp. 1404]MEA3482476.1 chemotaxis protein CheV [Pseudomonadota bacterium]NAW54650.1 response regulator [Vibrio sp. V41_P2S12T139]NAW93847.1 response regulator [Vibrio sp. 
MTGILDSVNQRTQLVGQNRLELLTFRLMGRQRYGINVFKVKEVLQCPKLTSMPNLHPLVKGIAHIRGHTVSVIDLSLAIGGRPTTDLDKCFVVIAEFNRTIQAFLVSSVERIINMHWEAILPPPDGAGKAHYLTAVTNIDNELVEILDVEKILAEIAPVDETMDSAIGEEIAQAEQEKPIVRRILIADDSTVARKQVERAITSIGFEVVSVKDGKEAYNKLIEMAQEGNIYDQISLVISDIEMPEMDGYTLTAEIRRHADLKDLYVILHSSLSGVFNQAMVERVGANTFIAKFNPDELGNAVKSALTQ